MEKKLKQIIDQVLKLPNIPKSMNICTRLIQQYFDSCNYETMTRLDWLEWYNKLDDLMFKFWQIRGR